MRTRETRTSRTRIVIAGAAVIALAGGTSAVAAKQITSDDIKDGTIQTRDLTTNNFGRFTATENVVSATTPVSAVPAHNGARVVEVTDESETGVVTLVLDQGTWVIEGTAQFWHLDGPAPSGTDIGVVTVPGLQDGFAKAFTADVPDGGVNAAQTSFSGTIKVAANNTPITITGRFNEGSTGEAGVSVQATQYVYVKQ